MRKYHDSDWNQYLVGDGLVGKYVRLLQDVERYPYGIFDAGLTGRVVKFESTLNGWYHNLEYRHKKDEVESFVHVQLDEIFEALEEWNNCLIFEGWSGNTDDNVHDFFDVVDVIPSCTHPEGFRNICISCGAKLPPSHFVMDDSLSGSLSEDGNRLSLDI